MKIAQITSFPQQTLSWQIPADFSNQKGDNTKSEYL